ncbi:hypothetical protein [Streptomyces sp. CoH17]|uniref:hypothetical protein n=1 Tax=Streptomyces sp. CoH17 TaxID=2992806 RepID=UPI002271F92A|nr:hypothetical protein [Streptomyces sp. CoH17]
MALQVQSKVKSSTWAAILSTAVAHYVFHDAVPFWAQLVIDTGVTGAVTFAAGYYTKHKAQFEWLEKVLRETGVSDFVVDEVLNSASLPKKVNSK